MSSRTHAKKIPEAEWNKHKEQIKDLYLEQGRQLQGSGGVIETMKDTYNFSPTKGQYESQFRKWDFRKNHDTKVWNNLGVKIRKRKSLGKDSTVLCQGEPIESSKVRKETSRHSFTGNADDSIDVPTPPTPAGFSIQTPLKRLDLDHWFRDLPFSQLEDSSFFAGNYSLTQDQQSLYLENEVTSTKDPIQDIVPLANVSNQVQTGVDSAASLIKSLLPSPDFCDLANVETLRVTSPESFNAIYFRSLLFSATNNFAAMTEHFQKTEMALLRNLTNDQISQLLSSVPGYGQQSFAQNFFKNAIMANDKRIVELLLTCTGTDIRVNDLVFEIDGYRFTAIELSSYQHNKDVVLTLIEHDANVQKTLMDSPVWFTGLGMPTGALSAVVYGLIKRPHPEPELVSALLGAGARISQIFLLRIIDIRYESLAEIIIRVKASEQMTGREIVEVFDRIISFADTKWIENVLELFLQTGADFNSECNYLDISPLRTALFYSNFDLAEKILDLGASATSLSISYGIIKYKPRLVQKLLSRGAKIYDHVIEEFVKTGNIEDVAVFLHQSPQSVGTLLCLRLIVAAIASGSCDMVKLLVSHGAPLANDSVALASCCGHSQVVLLLLDLGADADSLTQGEVRYPFPRRVTAFSEALIHNNLAVARILQRRGALRNITEESRYRATLFAASEAGNVAVARWLLKQGVSIQGHRVGPDFGRRTPSGIRYQTTATHILSEALSIAMLNGHQVVAYTLLDAGAKPSEKIILTALRMKDTRMVRAVLDFNKSAYLSQCGEEQCDAIVEWVESAPLDELLHKILRYDPYPLLVSAISMHKWNVVQQILDSGMRMSYAGCGSDDHDDYDRSRLDNPYLSQDRRDHILLISASGTGNVGLVKQLLRMGADPCCSQAIGQEEVLANKEMLQTLLEAYVFKYKQPQKDYGFRALVMAIQNGDVPLVRLLISHNVDPNGKGSFRCMEGSFETPLSVTIPSKTGSSLEIAGILLEQGARPNSPAREKFSDSSIETAIMMAISSRNVVMVQLIIKHGADVNLPAAGGRKRTPLQHAAEEGDFDIVQTLLNNGAHVNDTPSYEAGGTPLQLAALKGYFAIVILLLQKDANVNADPSKINGRTALEGAAEYGRIDTVQLLLNVGADINGPRGLRNGLAMQLAEENGQTATLELLRNYLATLDEQVAASPAVVDEMITAEDEALQMDLAVQSVPDDQVIALEWPLDAEFENTSSIGW